MVFIWFQVENWKIRTYLKLNYLKICKKAIKKDHKFYSKAEFLIYDSHDYFNRWFILFLYISKGVERFPRDHFMPYDERVETNARPSPQVHITNSLILNFSKLSFSFTVTYPNSHQSCKRTLSTTKILLDYDYVT